MKLVTVLLTSALVVGGLGAGGYAMTEGQSPTIKNNTDVQEQTVSTEKAKEMALDVTEGAQVTKVQVDDDANTEIQNISLKVSPEEAKKIALTQVKGTVIEAKLDDDDNRLLYEIEIKTSDNQKVEVKVDATNGEVLKMEQYDRYDDNDDDNKLQNVSPKISLEEAKKIALAEIKGTVTEAELDDDDNRLLYEIEILTSNHREAEVKVDATTGKVLKAEIDD
jgi:uncharacterized membrane protein YkoI